jgi:hypothetical protein
MRGSASARVDGVLLPLGEPTSASGRRLVVRATQVNEVGWKARSAARTPPLG